MKQLKRNAIEAPEELLLEINDQGEFEEWTVPPKAPTRYLSHGYFRYIGKFPPQIIQKIFLDYGRPGGSVLDPMCGGGTTLIEAGRYGMNAVGMDINPVSRLISQVTSTGIDPKKLQDVYNDCNKLLTQLEVKTTPIFQSNNHNRVPKRLKRDLKGMEKYFDKDALQELLQLQEYISGIEDAAIQDFFQLAVLAILRQVSRANVKKMNTEIDETKTIQPVSPTFRKQLKRMMEANELLIESDFPRTDIRVLEGIAEETGLDNESFDLVVLHPPYISGTAFSESVQLQLAWLGIKHKELIPKELAMRGSYFHKTNGLQKYLVGWSRILGEAYRVLCAGGFCVAIVGDGSVSHVRIPMGPITAEFGRDHGFTVEKWAKHSLHHNTGRTLNRRMTHQDIVILKKG